MEIRTHSTIDRALCGEPEAVEEGYARVRLQAGSRMSADASGLVHGGFIFGLADYAAMLAVNHPNVVLGRVEARFVKPVAVGDEMTAEAEVVERRGTKRLVQVAVRRGEEMVFDGEFHCYVPDRHVLGGPRELTR